MFIDRKVNPKARAPEELNVYLTIRISNIPLLRSGADFRYPEQP